MSGVAYYSRNVFDDIKFRSKMPVVAEAADVVATRLRPAMGHPGCPAPAAQGACRRISSLEGPSLVQRARPDGGAPTGRFFSLNRTGPGVRRCVLRCPYESLKHVTTTVKGYAEVTKVEYYNKHGLCDIHVNYIVSGAPPWPHAAPACATAPRSAAHVPVSSPWTARSLAPLPRRPALEPMRRAVDEACNGAAKFLAAEESESSSTEHKVKAMLESRADARALCKAARKVGLWASAAVAHALADGVLTASRRPLAATGRFERGQAQGAAGPG